MSFHYAPPLQPYLTVLYRDEDILVLSKPSGLLSVPGRPAGHADCLERRAQQTYPAATTIHRLDRDTSGVTVMGMNRKAHAHVSLQFEKRQTHKTYIARVWGRMSVEKGSIDGPIACDWPNRPMQMIDHENGRPAQTDWEMIGCDDISCRLRLTPLTGRSHQLRVHMLSIGHPILGDNFYGPEEARHAADRLQLHAETLSFSHPRDGRRLDFTDPCPF